MAVDLPLPAQLSAALVAFTIELDNEAERRLAHHTTSFSATGGRGTVWLTSSAMWFNCVRGLADAPSGESTVAELERTVRMTTNLDGMRRWGYLTIDGVGRVRRGAPRPKCKPGSVLALTPSGRVADQVWRSLPREIERRWRERHGERPIRRLRGALVAIASQIDAPLPDFIPIGGPYRRDRDPPHVRDPADRAADAQLPLISLLARVLLRFELDYERATRLSLAIWCDLIRVLDPADAVPLRDLPALTGVSKEAQSMMLGRLRRNDCVVLEPLPAPRRGRQVRLSYDRGVRARSAGWRRIDATLQEWEQSYGADAVARLRAALAPIVGDGSRDGSPLFTGLTPDPDGWRARVPAPPLLPWYPMVLHRGGYPDGS